ncbi:2 3-dimethylmalate lyase isoform X2 [Prunus yedoensis var. nudiflora]|uniref:2 3-dimethylmalate lyase isoform X2 n=1 Tax=Prunus yedoensis var. nudiflora TaxID=2094558 RepID=A0A314YPH1_PRUYE|nr:2 3-dimethylmalate lyase isoform X2 [Prunus yedoensis var. nudiflora]
MNLQPQVLSRDCTFSLPHTPSFNLSTKIPPSSNLTFGSSLHQRPLSLPHKLNHAPSASPAKRGVLQPVAAYSRDRESAPESPAKALRRILDLPGVHQAPACFDALSAKLVERAGFQCCFTSGFSISAARLGFPDTGLISYGEMVDQGQQITQAVSIPVIGDGDNGYGNAMNVKRTVKGYIKAGFAGILLEDQVSPKACGHTKGRKVVSREEAVIRIRAAVDARKESGSDIVIVARTDSRQAVSLDEALWRSRAFADAGADVLFIDALTSKEEMKAFCGISSPVPKMEALAGIRGGRIPPPGSMPSFEEVKEILGFNNYYDEESGYFPVTSNVYSLQRRVKDDAEQKDQSPQDPIVEVITPDVYNNYGADGSRGSFSGIWSRTLRVKITGRDGFEKLDVRIPAGFLDGITNIVPALGGVNIKELLNEAADEMGGKVLLDFNDTIGDRIQVFLE